MGGREQAEEGHGDEEGEEEEGEGIKVGRDPRLIRIVLSRDFWEFIERRVKYLLCKSLINFFPISYTTPIVFLPFDWR